MAVAGSRSQSTAKRKKHITGSAVTARTTASTASASQADMVAKDAQRIHVAEAAVVSRPCHLGRCICAHAHTTTPAITPTVPEREDQEESWSKLVAAQTWGRPFTSIAIRQGTKHIKRRKLDAAPSSIATPPAPTQSTSARPVTPPPPGARELLEWEFYHRQTRELRMPEILTGASEEYALDVVRWGRWIATHQEDVRRRTDEAIEYLRANFGTEDFD